MCDQSEGGTAVVPAARPLKISGEATVFEANVQWQLSDATGRVVDQGFVTASAGAPDRGTFDISVTIPDALRPYMRGVETIAAGVVKK